MINFTYNCSLWKLIGTVLSFSTCRLAIYLCTSITYKNEATKIHQAFMWQSLYKTFLPFSTYYHLFFFSKTSLESFQPHNWVNSIYLSLHFNNSFPISCHIWIIDVFFFISYIIWYIIPSKSLPKKCKLKIFNLFFKEYFPSFASFELISSVLTNMYTFILPVMLKPELHSII